MNGPKAPSTSIFSLLSTIFSGQNPNNSGHRGILDSGSFNEKNNPLNLDDLRRDRFNSIQAPLFPPLENIPFRKREKPIPFISPEVFSQAAAGNWQHLDGRNALARLGYVASLGFILQNQGAQPIVVERNGCSWSDAPKKKVVADFGAHVVLRPHDKLTCVDESLGVPVNLGVDSKPLPFDQYFILSFSSEYPFPSRLQGLRRELLQGLEGEMRKEAQKPNPQFGRVLDLLNPFWLRSVNAALFFISVRTEQGTDIVFAIDISSIQSKFDGMVRDVKVAREQQRQAEEESRARRYAETAWRAEELRKAEARATHIFRINPAPFLNLGAKQTDVDALIAAATSYNRSRSGDDATAMKNALGKIRKSFAVQFHPDRFTRSTETARQEATQKLARGNGLIDDILTMLPK